MSARFNNKVAVITGAASAPHITGAAYIIDGGRCAA